MALIRLDLGELLLRYYARERTQSVEHLKSAVEELQDMGMLPALTRVTELLNQINGARRRRAHAARARSGGSCRQWAQQSSNRGGDGDYRGDR